MKRLIFIIASILLGQTVCAQDIIQKKDATEIQAKVLKITDTEIEYQRWDNPDGPIYTIPAEDVFTITYQNGSKEVISHFDSSRRSAADKQQFGKLPRYQGEVAFAYGSAVSEGMQDLFPRIVFETVHGVRINPYLFAVSAWESIISTKTSISPTVGTYTNWAIAEPSSPYLRM